MMVWDGKGTIFSVALKCGNVESFTIFMLSHNIKAYYS